MTDYSRQEFIDTLADLRNQAKDSGALNTAVSAQVALGKVLGYDNSGPFGESLQNLSADELMERIHALLIKNPELLDDLQRCIERARIASPDEKSGQAAKPNAERLKGRKRRHG